MQFLLGFNTFFGELYFALDDLVDYALLDLLSSHLESWIQLAKRTSHEVDDWLGSQQCSDVNLLQA